MRKKYIFGLLLTYLVFALTGCDGLFTMTTTGNPPITTTTISSGDFSTSDSQMATYTISFDTGEGEALSPLSARQETPITLPIPIRVGYSFSGWHLDDITYVDAFNALTMPAENITIYAKWTINQYTISFDASEGSLVESITQDYSTSVIEPTVPSRAGYTFDGWYSNSSLTTPYTFTTMPAQNVTLYAKWDINSYTLQYVDYNDTVLQTMDYAYNTNLSSIIPPVTSRTGYSFTGWDISLPLSMPSSNVTIKAQYTINQYTISFDMDGGSTVDSITQNYGTAVTQPSNPEKVGYTFGGWYSDNGLTIAYVFTTMPLDGMTLYAKWILNDYTMTFEENGGASVSDITQGYLTTVTAPSNPTKIGHTFGGWYSDNGLTIAYTFTMMPSSNLTLYAKWTAISTSITFEENGGTSVSDITQGYLTTITAPASPTKDGYSFGGWYSDNGLTIAYTFTTMPLSNLTLYAKWFFDFTYTISGTNVTITGYVGNKTVIVIPTQISGFNVTEIAANAFINKNQLTSVTIPIGITTIGDYAFSGCSRLISITIPTSVTSLGNFVFTGCAGLKNIYFNATSVSTTSRTFESIYGGTGGVGIVVTIGANVTTLPANIFLSNDTVASHQITRVLFEENSKLTSIGNNAFGFCRYLESIAIPASVVSIGTAFNSNYRLVIYTSAASKPAGWVSNWNDGRPVYWGVNSSNFAESNGAQYVLQGTNATLTKYLGAATTFVIPTQVSIDGQIRSISGIGAASFYGCISLTSVTIPSSITSIGDEAFNNCKGLTSIYFNAVNCADLSVDNDAFRFAGQNGSGIRVTIDTNVTRIPAYLFHSEPKIISVAFGANSICNTIGAYAFYNNASLLSITIVNIFNVGAYAFTGCSSLTVYTNIGSKPTGWNINWNSSSRPVVWGCDVSTDRTYVKNFNKADTIDPPVLSNPNNFALSAPYRVGYTFDGWYLGTLFTGTKYPTLANTPAYKTLYAKWI